MGVLKGCPRALQRALKYVRLPASQSPPPSVKRQVGTCYYHAAIRRGIAQVSFLAKLPSLLIPQVCIRLRGPVFVAAVPLSVLQPRLCITQSRLRYWGFVATVRDRLLVLGRGDPPLPLILRGGVGSATSMFGHNSLLHGDSRGVVPQSTRFLLGRL